MTQRPDNSSAWRLVGHEPLPEEVVEQTAERLRVVAKAQRIALLEALHDGEAAVQELSDRVGLAHQNASHHLALLWQAGILSRRREGVMTLYAIEGLERVVGRGADRGLGSVMSR
jgi:DNA-binding transcriptional ArsR family regulator